MRFAPGGPASQRVGAIGRRSLASMLMGVSLALVACGPPEPVSHVPTEVGDVQGAANPQRLSTRKPATLCRQAFSLSAGGLEALSARARGEGRLDDLTHCFALPPFERLLTTEGALAPEEQRQALEQMLTYDGTGEGVGRDITNRLAGLAHRWLVPGQVSAALQRWPQALRAIARIYERPRRGPAARLLGAFTPSDRLALERAIRGQRSTPACPRVGLPAYVELRVGQVTPGAVQALVAEAATCEGQERSRYYLTRMLHLLVVEGATARLRRSGGWVQADLDAIVTTAEEMLGWDPTGGRTEVQLPRLAVTWVLMARVNGGRLADALAWMARLREAGHDLSYRDVMARVRAMGALPEDPEVRQALRREAEVLMAGDGDARREGAALTAWITGAGDGPAADAPPPTPSAPPRQSRP